MFKKLDRLVFTSFVPPFIAAFSIAMFVLLMQMLWLYIDDIAGKGLGVLMIIELLSYRSMALVPMALPLGCLIASVMVMGNLAERYELSSIKSAGVSLWRSMRPLVLFGIVAAFFSVYCSNTLIPQANLKFGSRMFDIQQKKPALRLEEGVFNYDFQGFAIRIGKKADDGKGVRDILIYDHSQSNGTQFTQIVAEEGDMYTSPDGLLFVMDLRNGYQYVEQRASSTRTSGRYPFIRTGFKEWVKIFDLSEFELSRTNPDLFKQNRQMMSTQQLVVAIDSMAIQIDKRKTETSNYFANFFAYEEHDSTYHDPGQFNLDEYRPEPESSDTITKEEQVQKFNESGVAIKVKGTSVTDLDKRMGGGKAIARKMDNPIEEYESFLQTFPTFEQSRLLNKAQSTVRSIFNQAQSANHTLDRMRENRVKFIYDMHMKYSMAVVCLIFIFIGAPLGAIIRKGGFGFPILASIIAFIIFVLLTISCRKIAETFILPAVAAAWIPAAILFPMGILLTYKAMRDWKLSLVAFKTFFQMIVAPIHDFIVRPILKKFSRS